MHPEPCAAVVYQDTSVAGSEHRRRPPHPTQRKRHGIVIFLKSKSISSRPSGLGLFCFYKAVMGATLDPQKPPPKQTGRRKTPLRAVDE